MTGINANARQTLLLNMRPPGRPLMNISTCAGINSRHHSSKGASKS